MNKNTWNTYIFKNIFQTPSTHLPVCSVHRYTIHFVCSNFLDVTLTIFIYFCVWSFICFLYFRLKRDHIYIILIKCFHIFIVNIWFLTIFQLPGILIHLKYSRRVHVDTFISLINLTSKRALRISGIQEFCCLLPLKSKNYENELYANIRHNTTKM